jgi:Integrase zinc binding domain
VLSKRSNFIRKEDKREKLLKLRKDSLEYNSKVAVVYKVIKDPVIKQRIQDVYKDNTRARIAQRQKYKENGEKLEFVLNETRLIRFRRVVYFLKRVKKEFVKEIYKELLVRHLRIDKTREAVTGCYYFSSISRIVEQVVKECDM